MKSRLLIGFIISFIEFGYAQTPEATINLYGSNFPQEKVYLHFDKETYLPGETVWLKAYVFEENLPSTRSTNFHLAFYNEAGILLESKLLPIINSSADGHFDLPDTLKGKQLICRAYTNWMMNFDSSLYFNRSIRLLENETPNQNTVPEKNVAVQLFPEGGDLLEGVSNTIAFKSNYGDGTPYHLEALLKRQETGEVLLSLKSVHNGMGKFDLLYEAGERYYVEWLDHKGNKQQTYLPTARKTGVSLKMVQQQNKLIYNLINKTGNSSLHILVYMYQKVVYKKDLQLTNSSAYTETLVLGTLPSGVVQFTVFDEAWKPLAERVFFLNNQQYQNSPDVKNKTINTRKRGKNIIEISLPDTIPANMSLSITDADLNNELRANNILSGLLLGGDLRGRIYQPAYYFVNAGPQQKSELDLVMLTHGWRRYNWDRLIAGKMPVINYPLTDYLTIYGRMSETAIKNIDSTETVNLFIRKKDSSNLYYSLKPMANGFVKQEGLIFFDTAKVYFSFNKFKSWNNHLGLSKENYSNDHQHNSLNNYRDFLLPDTMSPLNPAAGLLFDYYNKNKSALAFNTEKTLQRVTVKSGGRRNWRNDPLVKLDERYTNGVFRGGAVAYSLDVMNDEMAAGTYDIYNYLAYKIPGLALNFDRELGGGKTLTFRDDPVVIFIDEHTQDNSVLQSTSIYDIAYVKFIQRFNGEGERFVNALAIYLKKGDDLIDRRPKPSDMRFVKVGGYAPLKEFYSPDYSAADKSSTVDTRTTLLWQPYIFTDKHTRKVPLVFYNNDLSKRFRVVLEGINEEGKLIHYEAVVE